MSKITLAILITFFCIYSCTKKNIDSELIGLWVNEQNDTLSFSESKLLKFSNYNPYHTLLFDYEIKKDSIGLFPVHSSNLSDKKWYYFNEQNSIIEIRDFNGLTSSQYLKQ